MELTESDEVLSPGSKSKLALSRLAFLIIYKYIWAYLFWIMGIECWPLHSWLVAQHECLEHIFI